MSCFDLMWSEDSSVLILGSCPSPASFASGFYYGHPHNRFGPMLARLLGEQLPVTMAEKRALLLRNHIVLWDVLQSRQQEGAADTAIRSTVPNKLAALTAGTQIRALFFNGTKAEALYRRRCEPAALPSFRMPSTSPANASRRVEALLSSWAAILPYSGEPLKPHLRRSSGLPSFEGSLNGSSCALHVDFVPLGMYNEGKSGCLERR